MRRASLSAMGVAAFCGAAALAAQTLLLRRFLWCFESTEIGVALFFSCWLCWMGIGAAVASTRRGVRITAFLSTKLWLVPPVCVGLYFLQYALISHLRVWMGIPTYLSFPITGLVLGCLLANIPFCFCSGFVLPAVAYRLTACHENISHAFAWEALGATLGGLVVLLLLVNGVPPDPRDVSEWYRYFPAGTPPAGRFETGAGTTFYGKQGDTFYALCSRGVSEMLPEYEQSLNLAVLLLSQRPYARSVVLLGEAPLAVGIALERLRPDIDVVWCPSDATYGVKLLEAVHDSQIATRVRAAGYPPRQYLELFSSLSVDAVLVFPPAATSLAGADWRTSAFLQRIRGLVNRRGVMLYGLACDEAILTCERRALLDATLQHVRQVWPEDGFLAAGGGGWWVAAQVSGLAYAPEVAAERFAMLKKEALFPASAVVPLYDPHRAKLWGDELAVLRSGNVINSPEEVAVETVLAYGLADAVRRDHPATQLGQQFLTLQSRTGFRLISLVVTGLWLLPVVLGRGVTVSQRLVAAWLAACGALGLVSSLVVLYRLQVQFGSLYLWAGAASCLYLAGLFCGNRVTEGLIQWVRQRIWVVCGFLLGSVVLQALLALGVLSYSSKMLTAFGMVLLCFPIGAVAGAAVPLSLALQKERSAQTAARFVLADALGAALAGVTFVVLVPLAGLWQTLVFFVVLTFGLACLVLGGRQEARLATGMALLLTLLALSAEVKDLVVANHDSFARSKVPEAVLSENALTPLMPLSTTNALPAPTFDPATPQGIPRKVEMSIILEQMREGRLATNEAAFWMRD